MEAAGLTYRSHYWDDHRAKEAFKTFLLSMHGVDLTSWETNGFWDERYVPFSLFEGDRIVASVCLYSMDLVIAGKRCRAGQLSGVGTLPEYRRRGLNRCITEEALRWAAPHHDGFFLFADDDAVPFYEKCGFVPHEERAAVLRLASPPARPGLRQLDIANDRDLDLIYQMACERTPVSNVLGVLCEKLLMFHCLNTLSDHAYHIPDLDLVIFFKTNQGRLTIFDIVGRQMPSFAEVHPFLSERPHAEVWLHFVPDKLRVEVSSWRSMPGNNLHVFPPGELAFPQATSSSCGDFAHSGVAHDRVAPGLQLPDQEIVFPFTAHA